MKPKSAMELHIQADELVTDQSYWAVATIDVGDDADALFEVVKAGYVKWRAMRGPGNHYLMIAVAVDDKSARYRAVVSRFCDRWNADAEVLHLCPIRVELKLEYEGYGWIGCTTGVDPCDVTRNQPEMHVFDYSEELKALNKKIDYLAATENGFRITGQPSRG
jgi:hypothetical protein